MGEIDLASLISMARPQAPVYQSDENAGDVIRPVPLVLPGGHSVGIANRPGDPGWQEKIRRMCPPDKIAGDELVPIMDSAFDKPKKSKKRAAPKPKEEPVARAPKKADVRKRLVVNYARDDGKYMVAVEAAPDWDTVGRPRKVGHSSIVEMLPVLDALGVPVKNLTEEEFGE